MSALARLILAGVAAALVSAPAMAMDTASKLDAAVYQANAHPGAAATQPASTTPEFCIAANKCAIALPGEMLIRYDQRMDQILGR